MHERDELAKNSGSVKSIRPPHRTAGPSAAPVTPQAAAMLNLQRLAGNAAVARALDPERQAQHRVGNAAVHHALPGQSDAVPVQRAPRDEYPPGTYGYRRRERRRLEDEEPTPISGSTHQMEHAWGYAATARYAPVPRRRDTQHEGRIGAYYETLEAHRAHPGTGSSSTIANNGLSSVTYRAMQEERLRDNDPGTPLLMNQVYYNDMPEFTRMTGTPAGRQSDSSFRAMLDANPPTPIYDSDGEERWTRRLRPYERADADVTRSTMRAGRYLDADEQRTIMDRYGATRTDEYPTRSRGPADDLELNSFPDIDSDTDDESYSRPPQRRSVRSRSPLRSRPTFDSDSDDEGYSRPRLIRLARDSSYRDRSPLRSRPFFDSDSD
ncbi:hypothetical protein C4J65_18460 [Streptomyces sp. CB09001]|uniref:hypothetical protein n=1 Tax=unclassified Streptomyces TaxID=2593676 RepID=UPI000E21001B|nr:hypothetical protein [Streptomyces sp. CB09001]AXL90044.1 hypothetical protein C4J65_18460 [Streptomyces sp. CB09001]